MKCEYCQSNETNVTGITYNGEEIDGHLICNECFTNMEYMNELEEALVAAKAEIIQLKEQLGQGEKPYQRVAP